MLPDRFRLRPEVSARFGSSAARLGRFLTAGDPLADAVVQDFARLPGGQGQRLLEQALTRGIGAVLEAPSSLVAFFEAVDHVPAWVDQEALQNGGNLLFRAGWFGGVALACSLLYGYASPAGNKPLALSGRLDAQAGRRLVETSRFVEATCVPGGLRRDAEGFAITVKVRIMHAHVRRLIAQRPDWSSAWGLPINQHDMAATSTLFSAAVIDSLRRLGFRFDEDEIHHYMQLWRYSGYLMGVDAELLPTSEREANRLMEMVALTEGPPDEDSRHLSRAMFASGEDPPRATLAEKQRALRVVRIGQGIIRGVLGDELANELDVPNHRYKHLFHAVRGVVNAEQAAETRMNSALLARLRRRSIRTGRDYWAMLTSAMVGPFEFAPPESLAGRVLAEGRLSHSRQSPLASARRSR